MKNQQIHPAQVSILYALRHAESLRYSDLRRPTGLESDVFKFHIQRLRQNGWIRKTTDGKYELSDTGSEYANTIDRRKRAVQKQPKLSVMIIVERTANGRIVYLCQKRMRRPYLGYYAFISGPLVWGESFEETARRELFKQTGLTAECVFAGIERARDFSVSDEQLLEDKVFILMRARNVGGDLLSEWRGGENCWLSVDEIESSDRNFGDSTQILNKINEHTGYIDRMLSVPDDSY